MPELGSWIGQLGMWIQAKDREQLPSRFTWVSLKDTREGKVLQWAEFQVVHWVIQFVWKVKWSYAGIYIDS